ncbi:MAG: hypothetical protein FJW86_11015 [Actinobacteria bacterium]|nr:hypothetical protein [Actinomycetota bacterium]
MTAPVESPYPQHPPYPPAYAPPQRTGVALASLICGIVGLVASILWLLSVPLGFIAVVLGWIGCAATASATERQGRYQAIAGVVLGSMALLIGLMSMLWWFPIT